MKVSMCMSTWICIGTGFIHGFVHMNICFKLLFFIVFTEGRTEVSST